MEVSSDMVIIFLLFGNNIAVDLGLLGDKITERYRGVLGERITERYRVIEVVSTPLTVSVKQLQYYPLCLT